MSSRRSLVQKRIRRVRWLNIDNEAACLLYLPLHGGGGSACAHACFYHVLVAPRAMPASVAAAVPPPEVVLGKRGVPGEGVDVRIELPRDSLPMKHTNQLACALTLDRTDGQIAHGQRLLSDLDYVFSNVYSNFWLRNFWQILRGSFSAVSKSKFASKY